MAVDRWIWQCDRVIPSETAAGRRILDEVLDQLRKQSWVDHDLFAVHLSLHEALINAIMHGNREDSAKRVHVRCRLSHELLQVEIADEGAGFDPADVPDPTDADGLERPSGRGVMLMKAFMSRVEYNQRGNQVTLEKRRDDCACC